MFGCFFSASDGSAPLSWLKPSVPLSRLESFPECSFRSSLFSHTCSAIHMSYFASVGSNPAEWQRLIVKFGSRWSLWCRLWCRKRDHEDVRLLRRISYIFSSEFLENFAIFKSKNFLESLGAQNGTCSRTSLPNRFFSHLNCREKLSAIFYKSEFVYSLFRYFLFVGI